MPPNSFTFVTYSVKHNNGDANCFITNNLQHFTSYCHHPIKVKLLNGSLSNAVVFAIKLIQCPTTNTITPLWPTYYMPTNPQCTFSPTALKHYLGYPEVLTSHLEALHLTTSSGIKMIFPSIKQQKDGQLLDYHNFTIVRPICGSVTSLPNMALALCLPTTSPYIEATANAGTIIPLTRNLVHQCLCHGCDDSLDAVC